MATTDHMPAGRGYDTSLGYFSHLNNYWNAAGKCVGVNGTSVKIYDFWDTTHGGEPWDVGCDETSIECYEETKFEQRATKIIAEHDPSKPLFLNYDFHLVHEPLQVPTAYFDAFDFIATSAAGDFKHNRQYYHAMVKFADDVLGNLTNALKAKGMWKNTLVVLQSDNGGPSWAGSSHTANNYPLKGSKVSNWEGGVRTNAFVAGPFLTKYARPTRVLGSKLTGLISIADWYSTFCALAGVPAVDPRAAAAHLPPLDSINMWPYIVGEAAASPRTTIHMDAGVLVQGDLKYLKNESALACWHGPQYPNATGPDASDCTRVESCDPCMYNLTADPNEHVNLAHDPAHAQAVERLATLSSKLDETIFKPNRGMPDPEACYQAIKYGEGKSWGFWGPWIA